MYATIRTHLNNYQFRIINANQGTTAALVPEKDYHRSRDAHIVEGSRAIYEIEIIYTAKVMR